MSRPHPAAVAQLVEKVLDDAEVMRQYLTDQVSGWSRGEWQSTLRDDARAMLEAALAHLADMPGEEIWDGPDA
jgi:hypothetical protein